jgi:hypothetical protein
LRAQTNGSIFFHIYLPKYHWTSNVDICGVRICFKRQEGKRERVKGGGGEISALTGVAEALAKILDLREQEGQEGERKGEDSDGSEETMTRLWVKT